MPLRGLRLFQLSLLPVVPIVVVVLVVVPFVPVVVVRLLDRCQLLGRGRSPAGVLNWHTKTCQSLLVLLRHETVSSEYL